MSDENVSSGQGRWDHLLREIPSQAKIEAPIKKAKPVPPPEPVEEEDRNIFSVSQINKAIKTQLEGQFTHLWIQGEISNFKAHSSGHYYFSLKDDKAQINAVMFRGFNAKLKFRPESGMEVVVRGKISVYEPRGNYQVFCEAMEPVGAGALQKAFEQLKNKLDAEGLFGGSIKKPLPKFPKNIGVVTSPTGAAIQDILNVLGRRSKRAQVTVIPARVQGDGAAAEVVRGIQMANQVGGFDVLIVGRGGGSIEDLWCFNEEIVARAIHQSKIPIISAVGHEIDFTIADFVADLRAPTPSAAAEVVAKSELELLEKLQFYSRSLRLVIYQKIKDLKSEVQFNSKRLIDPRKYLEDSIMRLDDWNQRLIQSTLRYIKNLNMQRMVLTKGLINPQVILQSHQQKNHSLFKMLLASMRQSFEKKQGSFAKQSSLLDSLSPLRTVDRGYGIVRQKGRLIPDIKSLKGSSIEIELRDGKLFAEVIKTESKEES